MVAQIRGKKKVQHVRGVDVVAVGGGGGGGRDGGWRACGTPALMSRDWSTHRGEGDDLELVRVLLGDVQGLRADGPGGAEEGDLLDVAVAEQGHVRGDLRAARPAGAVAGLFTRGVTSARGERGDERRDSSSA